MKNFIKENWFKMLIIILLLMIYFRLGKVIDNTFYTADVVDSSISRIINSFEDYLSDIRNNTQNTWQILDNHY